MCAVSMIGDHYADKWQNRDWWPQVVPSAPFVPADGQTVPGAAPVISRAEFDALKREVAELKDLLKRAADYDARTGQPDCEMDEKMDLLRKVAKLVGVDIEDALGRGAAE